MARADYIVFLDDDALPDKNFVANIHANFTKHNICGLRGKVLPKNPDNSPIAPACYDLGDDVLVTTCEVSSHSAFKKDVFLSQMPCATPVTSVSTSISA